MISLTIMSMLFKTGDTLLDKSRWSKPDLTYSERHFVDTAREEIAKQCPEDNSLTCSIDSEQLVMEAVNGRRISAAVMQWSPTADAVGYTCAGPAIIKKLTCYSNLRKLSYEEAMARSGYRRFGVSRAGYQKIAIGMNMRDVKYILGSGEELAYSGGNGASASIYKWRQGRAIIILSFRDFEVSGRSQLGL